MPDFKRFERRISRLRVDPTSFARVVRGMPLVSRHERWIYWTGTRIRSRAARIPCYTGAMENTRQNVTLVVDEDLLLAARKVALDQRTSVNQLVREYLAALVEEPSRRRLARARLRKAFETGLVDVGNRNWSRDDLHDR